jgi:hypothetical protein
VTDDAILIGIGIMLGGVGVTVAFAVYLGRMGWWRH